MDDIDFDCDSCCEGDCCSGLGDFCSCDGNCHSCDGGCCSCSPATCLCLWFMEDADIEIKTNTTRTKQQRTGKIKWKKVQKRNRHKEEEYPKAESGNDIHVCMNHEKDTNIEDLCKSNKHEDLNKQEQQKHKQEDLNKQEQQKHEKTDLTDEDDEDECIRCEEERSEKDQLGRFEHEKCRKCHNDQTQTRPWNQRPWNQTPLGVNQKNVLLTQPQYNGAQYDYPGGKQYTATDSTSWNQAENCHPVTIQLDRNEVEPPPYNKVVDHHHIQKLLSETSI